MYITLLCQSAFRKKPKNNKKKNQENGNNDCFKYKGKKSKIK